MTLRDSNLVWKLFRNGMVDKWSLFRAQNNYAGRIIFFRLSGEL